MGEDVLSLRGLSGTAPRPGITLNGSVSWFLHLLVVCLLPLRQGLAMWPWMAQNSPCGPGLDSGASFLCLLNDR